MIDYAHLFENTCATPVECHQAIEEALDDDKSFADFIDGLGWQEREAFKWMYELCQEFIESYNKLRGIEE